MHFEFKLPDLGEGIVEGEVVKWLVKEGDEVKEDMPLLEVMTDKATVEITSPKNGRIHKILVKEGELVQVEQVMVLIEIAGGEDVQKTPHAKPHLSVAAAPQIQSTPSKGPVQASPATRNLARQLNVDLSLVQGTGPQGRITNEDVEKFTKKAAPKTNAISQVHEPHEDKVERVPFRGLRKKIAENMTRSVHTVAHFSYVDTVDMTELVQWREILKNEAQNQGVKLTYLPFIMKSCAEALKKFPRFNASLDEEKHEIILKKFYHLGVATATDQGLVVPVIRDVDQKSVLELARAVEEVTARARVMKADLSELKGSSFTITSLGALGGLFATPIINYPETSIMGIYQIKPTPAVLNNQITVRSIMYFSLSLDHRVIDGHEAAAFGNEFKRYLENPQLLFSKLT